MGKGLLKKLGPEAAARTVVDRWASKRSRDWAEEYYEGISKADLEEMERNLADWYRKLDRGREWLSIAMAMIKAGVSPKVAKEVLAAVR